MSNASVKQGLRRYMEVELRGLTEYENDLQRIEILFCQDQNSEPLKTAVWLADGSGDCELDGDVLKILWAREETYRFQQRRSFYMDIRPTLKTGFDVKVDPVPIEMSWTLFREETEPVPPTPPTIPDGDEVRY